MRGDWYKRTFMFHMAGGITLGLIIITDSFPIIEQPGIILRAGRHKADGLLLLRSRHFATLVALLWRNAITAYILNSLQRRVSFCSSPSNTLFEKRVSCTVEKVYIVGSRFAQHKRMNLCYVFFSTCLLILWLTRKC